jgi:hypothetical protein
MARLVAAMLLPVGVAHAQAPSATPPADSPLSRYLTAMVKARLAPMQDANAAELRARVAAGQRLALEQRYDEAAVLLLEALEGPRFNDFRDFDEYAAAEFTAASALMRLGSHATARRYLERLVARGPSHPYYGPAVRSLVDVALLLSDLDDALLFFAPFRVAMTADAKNELHYLQARAHLLHHEDFEAVALLLSVTKQSRFYANARYLLGVIAARTQKWKTAEKRFCSIAQTGRDDRYSFYVDERFFEVQDLARLGLGRIAHERRRGDDAFYYYFQVPQDSPRLPEAMFEAAYASYESSENDTALDLLDQLQRRFPDSAFVDEATVLRGYVALARCDFEDADRYLAVFAQQFGPVLHEIDRVLANPSRREALQDELLSAARGEVAREPSRRRLLGLLRVDPEFYRLRSALDELDAEAARAGRLPDALGAIAVRLSGGERPKPLANDSESERDALLREVELARETTRAVGGQLDALRAAGARQPTVSTEERVLGKLAQRLDKLAHRTQRLQPDASAATDAGEASARTLPELLSADRTLVTNVEARVRSLRERLVDAANARTEAALRELRIRLDSFLRRARIGRVDAVMGSKRRIEHQIESLAAGRFPVELRDPLRAQGLLADDQEYWPFEGEDWPDEYEERLPEGSGKKPAAPKGANP